jgi:outer membrane protein assembly factor BamB
VFLNAADRATGELVAICVDAGSGELLWQHGHGKNRSKGRNDMTSPSPVTDGRCVVFMFGTGRLVAYDYAGNLLWERDLVEEFGMLSWLFGYGASPQLHAGRLYIQMMRRPTHRDAPPDKPLEPFLLAVDPASGKDLWRELRPSKAVDESWESYGTPIPMTTAADSPIVLVGADAVTTHDPGTGGEIWRWEFNEARRRNWRQVPSPVSDGRRVFASVGRGRTMVALAAGTQTGPAEDRALWSVTQFAPDVCSPLLYDGRLYMLDGDRRVMTCLDPATGNQAWQGEVGGDTVIRSSPTAADRKIYFMDESGRVFVVAAGDELRVLSRIEMGGGKPARSSIAIAGGRLYIRTASALHCVGKM